MGCRFCRLTKLRCLCLGKHQSRLIRSLMEANPAGQPADMVAEVHDETRDHDGPETNGQRNVIVGRLTKEFRHGRYSECGRQDEQRPGYLRTSAAPPEETP
jgi:hypothetical protein